MIIIPPKWAQSYVDFTRYILGHKQSLVNESFSLTEINHFDWLLQVTYMTTFNQSECIILAKCNYVMLKYIDWMLLQELYHKGYAYSYNV